MRKYILTIAILCLIAGAPPAAPGADFSYSHYETVLTRYVKSGVTIDGIGVSAVDYGALARDAAKPDSPYSLLLKELAAFDPATLVSREEKMAFWINVYNIAAIKTIIDHYPVDSIRSRKINWLGLPWGRKAITVGGKQYSLEGIEFGELVEGLRDLRIHFGINCASVSCVDLRSEPFRAGMLDQQLEEEGKRFLASEQKGMRIDRTGKKVYLSQIFKFDKKHFDAYAGGAVKFILPYASEEDRNFLQSGKYDMEYLDYDWNANDLKNAK
jgi:hypothetical protein